MSHTHLHPVMPQFSANALINQQQYQEMYSQSVQNPDNFWREQGKIVDWIRPYQSVKNTSYDSGHVSIRWFEDGTLNLSANCIDRHLATRGDETAIIWEGDNPAEDKKITYRQLHQQVCQFANALKAQGVRKGDVVAIYMPMVVEAAVAMLACARIGAIHS
ncbi:MAG: AMP-binding protein, partial [Plesiomonas sp.]